jgi:carbonic anhydrase
MSTTDDLLAHNAEFAAGFDAAGLPTPPARKVAVLACMDTRLDPARALGLEPGDAHVIRNAGGVVTEDAIRSLVISQRLLGTEEIILIHHTGCGMLSFTDDQVLDGIEAEVGTRPDFALHSFADLDKNVRQSLASLRANPYLPHTASIRGFVYDTESGALREVS